MPMVNLGTRRHWRGLSVAALLAAGLVVPGLVVPAHAAGTVVVAGNVTGDHDSGDEAGIYVPLSACDAAPSDESFDPGDCESEYWYNEGEDGFHISDFPVGKYLVAGDLDDEYADYVPAAVSNAPITAPAGGLGKQLVARPDVDLTGVTASLSPRQAIAGQEIALTVSGLPDGAAVGYYQWPGDTDEDEDMVLDNIHNATYTVPAGELDNDQEFFVAAGIEQSGHRRAYVFAQSPYRVWESEQDGGVLKGTITDAAGLIDSPEDIDLAICDETGTGIGVAGSDAYLVTRIDGTHFTYEVIVPNGEYCLAADIYRSGEGNTTLLASSTNPHWVPLVNDDYSGAEMFEVTGASTTTIDLDFVADDSTGDDEIELRSAPAFSTTTPTVGTPVSVTSLPSFVGSVDSVDYLWTIRTGGSLWEPQQFDAAPYTPASRYAGKQLYLRVTADRGGATYDRTFLVGTIRPAATLPAPKLAMPKGAVTKLPTTVAGVKKGKVKAGTKLKVKPPKVTLPGATVSYQWTLNGKPVAGATKATFKTKKKHKGKKVGVIVTVSKPGYLPVVKTVKAGKVK